jgi:hypothetical protein
MDVFHHLAAGIHSGHATNNFRHGKYMLPSKSSYLSSQYISIYKTAAPIL